MAADARRSDLSGALAALADRYPRPRLAGVVVVSDGGDTADRRQQHRPARRARCSRSASAAPDRVEDREVINLTAGEPLLSDSSVDLSVGGDEPGLRHGAD